MKSSANFGHAQLSTTFGLMFGRRGTLRRPEFRRQGHDQPWSVGVRLRSHATRKRGRPRHHPVPLYLDRCASCVYGRTTNAQNSDPIRPNQPGAIRSAAGSHVPRAASHASRGRRWMCARNTLMGILKGTGRVWSAGVRRGRGVRLSLSNKRPAIRTVYRMQKPIRFCDG